MGELRRAVEREAGDGLQALDGVAGDVARVLPHGVHPEPGQVVDGGAEADRLGDRHGARLEARGRLGELGLVVADAGDHVPAAEERRHRLEQLAAAVQHADAGRPVGLVTGPGVEVGAERGDVDRQVRDGLRAVDQHERAGGVRELGDLGDRVDRAEHVGDVADREQLRPAREQVAERLHVEQARVGDRHVGQLRALLGAQQLPRHEVGVVLHLRDDHEVAGADVGAAPAVGDEVDRLGRVAREDRLAGRGAGERRDALARALVGLGRARGQRVHAAVDRRAVLGVVLVHRLDHRPRGLRRRGRVEVRQVLLREDGEVGRCRSRERHAAAATSSRIQP